MLENAKRLSKIALLKGKSKILRSEMAEIQKVISKFEINVVGESIVLLDSHENFLSGADDIDRLNSFINEFSLLTNTSIVNTKSLTLIKELIKNRQAAFKDLGVANYLEYSKKYSSLSLDLIVLKLNSNVDLKDLEDVFEKMSASGFVLWIDNSNEIQLPEAIKNQVNVTNQSFMKLEYETIRHNLEDVETQIIKLS